MRGGWRNDDTHAKLAVLSTCAHATYRDGRFTQGAVLAILAMLAPSPAMALRVAPGCSGSILALIALSRTARRASEGRQEGLRRELCSLLEVPAVRPDRGRCLRFASAVAHINLQFHS